MNSIPRSDIKLDRLKPITGNPPDLLRVPSGCAFRPRCPYVKADCAIEIPPLVELPLPESGVPRHTACRHWDEVYR